jgi:predicted secreted hydrolase
VLVLAVVVGGAVLAVALWPGGLPSVPGAGIQASLAVREALGDSGGGFARALDPRPLSFPDDHGPHPDFRTEWWYYTGNLRTPAGRHFGFELTFFRVALAPATVADSHTPSPTTGSHIPAAPTTAAGSHALASSGDDEPRASAWATRQLLVAHFAVTDTTGKRFHATSRVSREALGLAGARARPFRVWVEDWSVEGEEPSALPMRLRAAEGDVALDLTLSATKPVVLQGDRGLSRKGAEPGNASYYYSLTRMPARGVVRVGGDSFDVVGLAWMDREWSTSALGPGLVGWDWFALQLEDGRDLMFYRLRGRDGSIDGFSAGSLVAADGSVRRLGAADVAIETLGHWTSPRSGVRYPGRWRLTLPSEHLEVELDPRLPDQELVVGTRYWEGAVTVGGTTAGRPTTGQGYVELVGYGE